MLSILNCKVQGGLESFIKIFFTKDGYHALDECSNDQYNDILRLFTTLDKCFPIFQQGIDKL